ncbi:PP2C family protein-serine/threonine phosphatase [candidate division KSB1 bacterium]
MKDRQKIVEIISDIFNSENSISGEHDIHETAFRLEKFEKLLDEFEKHDRRKSESEDRHKQYSEVRNNEKNELIKSLVEQMREKISFFENELDVARDIQQKMVPRDIPSIGNFTFYGYYQPCRQVGGDYYDYIKTKNGKVFFMIGDVSGKGLPSSLIVACLQAYLQAEVHNRRAITSLITDLNQYLTEKLINEKYVTFFIGLLDPKTNIIKYINAGHNPPILIRNGKSGSVKELKKGGPILGMFMDAQYSAGQTKLAEGDLLVLFTDGIVEAFNYDEEEFSEERLIEILRSQIDRPLDKLTDHIREKLDEFCEYQPPGDDLTLFLLKRVQ